MEGQLRIAACSRVCVEPQLPQPPTHPRPLRPAPPRVPPRPVVQQPSVFAAECAAAHTFRVVSDRHTKGEGPRNVDHREFLALCGNWQKVRVCVWVGRRDGKGGGTWQRTTVCLMVSRACRGHPTVPDLTHLTLTPCHAPSPPHPTAAAPRLPAAPHRRRVHELPAVAGLHANQKRAARAQPLRQGVRGGVWCGVRCVVVWGWVGEMGDCIRKRRGLCSARAFKQSHAAHGLRLPLNDCLRCYRSTLPPSRTRRPSSIC